MPSPFGSINERTHSSKTMQTFYHYGSRRSSVPPIPPPGAWGVHPGCRAESEEGLDRREGEIRHRRPHAADHVPVDLAAGVLHPQVRERCAALLLALLLGALG